MSAQVRTIERSSWIRAVVAVVAAGILAIGVTTAILVFRGSSAPTGPAATTEQVSAGTTDQGSSSVSANTPTETMLIHGGLQPRPYVRRLTPEQVRALQLAATGIDQVNRSEQSGTSK